MIPRSQNRSIRRKCYKEIQKDASVLSDLSKTPDQTNHIEKKRFKPLLDPLRVLMACGWLTAAEAADPGLKVDTLTRAHQVVRVTAPDGRAIIVKQPTPEARQSGRNLQRELYVYRLAGWMNSLSKLLPAPLLIDETRQLLVCECLAFESNWPEEMKLEPISTPYVAKQLGKSMADWHRETKEIALEPSPAPGILYIADSLDIALEGKSDSAQDFLRSLVADSELSEALHEGAEVYQPLCLIHGDIRPDNWVVKQDQTDQTPIRLKVFDWEMSGLGDPAWDIASACVESIIQLIRTDMSTLPDASGWPALAVPTLREFICAYTAVQGVIDIHNAATWNRVALLTVTRLLHVVCEWAEYSYNIDTGKVELLVAQARNLLRTRQQIAVSLANWTQS